MLFNVEDYAIYGTKDASRITLFLLALASISTVSLLRQSTFKPALRIFLAVYFPHIICGSKTPRNALRPPSIFVTNLSRSQD